MNPTAASAICILIALTAFGALCAARWAWRRVQNWAARHIEQHLAAALSKPLYGDHKTLDQEYRDLITKETNHGN